MRVCEVFHTIQGEGRAMGLPTTFVRTTGCNLRCTWCDTTYSFYDGEELAPDEVLRRVEAHPGKRVCLTGGEPLLQRDAPGLVQALLARGYEVVVETSGSLDVAPYAALEPRRNLVLSLDAKPPGSGMAPFNLWSNLPRLEAHDQLKIVVADEHDYQWARRIAGEHPTRAELILQACWGDGGSNLRWLAERVLKDGWDVRVGTQLHKHIWGEERAR